MYLLILFTQYYPLLVTEEISQVIFGFFFDQILTGFWHNLYIRRLPGPSPRLLPGLYPYFRGDFQDSEGTTYQKPIRKNKENINNPIIIPL